jgi:hypothetical protein
MSKKNPGIDMRRVNYSDTKKKKLSASICQSTYPGGIQPTPTAHNLQKQQFILTLLLTELVNIC